MKTLVLDGSSAGDGAASRVNAALLSGLEACGWSTEVIVVREKKIGNCMGDLLCWLKSPGKCHIADDNLAIAEKFIQNDLVILLMPVTFGGYSAVLKGMVDHLVQNTSPFFAKINGEIHHQKRYDKYPNVLVIGWLSEPDEHAESIFRHLAWRNSINLYPDIHLSAVVYGNQPDSALAATITHCLSRIERGESDPKPALPATPCSSAAATPVRRALLLVGSPRIQKSSSSSLGSYLIEQLGLLGVETETIYLYKALHSAERMEALRHSLDAADLVVLAFPLYVDSLPAPVISVFEQVAETCRRKKSATRFAAIVNSGFPQAQQNENALALCAEFARSAGFEWMGGLALGGGEGMVHAHPLNELGGRAIPLRKSLESAAKELAAGLAISENAKALMAKSLIPEWLYILAGSWGWKKQARTYGTEKLLRSRPYLKAEL